MVEDKSLTMLYQIREGPCLESFGIHVSQIAGFPSSVIDEAKRKAEELESWEIQYDDSNNNNSNSNNSNSSGNDNDSTFEIVSRLLKQYSTFGLNELK